MLLLLFAPRVLCLMAKEGWGRKCLHRLVLLLHLFTRLRTMLKQRYGKELSPYAEFKGLKIVVAHLLCSTEVQWFLGVGRIALMVRMSATRKNALTDFQ